MSSPASLETASELPTETEPEATVIGLPEPADSDARPHASQESDDPQSEPESTDPGEPGALLKELEARQDEVLESLAELDRQICDVLRDCGVTLDGEEDSSQSTSEVSLTPTSRAA